MGLSPAFLQEVKLFMEPIKALGVVHTMGGLVSIVKVIPISTYFSVTCKVNLTRLKTSKQTGVPLKYFTPTHNGFLQRIRKDEKMSAKFNIISFSTNKPTHQVTLWSPR